MNLDSIFFQRPSLNLLRQGKGEKLRLSYIEHHITDHCNLNCAGCTHFSPLANPWFEDLEDFKKDFQALANTFSVSIIRLMGGEPLLHPQVKDFIIETRKLFPHSKIEIVSNGILVQKDPELIGVLNKNKVFLSVSDYGILDLTKQLEGINYKIRWERAQMYNLCLDLNGGQNPSHTHKNCISRKNACNYYQNGNFYPCAIVANIDKFNKYFDKNLPIDTGISIYEHTAGEIIDYLYKNSVELCKYCNIDKSKNSYHSFCQSNKDIKEWIY